MIAGALRHAARGEFTTSDDFLEQGRNALAEGWPETADAPVAGDGSEATRRKLTLGEAELVTAEHRLEHARNDGERPWLDEAARARVQEGDERYDPAAADRRLATRFQRDAIITDLRTSSDPSARLEAIVDGVNRLASGLFEGGDAIMAADVLLVFSDEFASMSGRVDREAGGGKFREAAREAAHRAWRWSDYAVAESPYSSLANSVNAGAKWRVAALDGGPGARQVLGDVAAQLGRAGDTDAVVALQQYEQYETDRPAHPPTRIAPSTSRRGDPLMGWV